MKFKEMIVLSPEEVKSYSPAQADLPVTDVIAVLEEGTEGRHQDKLRSVLIAAKRRAVGEQPGTSAEDMRPDVQQKIKDAEVHGDERTARYLQESMAGTTRGTTRRDYQERDYQDTHNKLTNSYE